MRTENTTTTTTTTTKASLTLLFFFCRLPYTKYHIALILLLWVAVALDNLNDTLFLLIRYILLAHVRTYVHTHVRACWCYFTRKKTGWYKTRSYFLNAVPAYQGIYLFSPDIPDQQIFIEWSTGTNKNRSDSPSNFPMETSTPRTDHLRIIPTRGSRSFREDRPLICTMSLMPVHVSRIVCMI